MSRLLLALMAVVAITAACYEDDTTANALNSPSQTNVLLTDAPFPFDTVQSVNVYVISVSVSPDPDTGSNANNMNWVEVTAPHRQINLLELQQGDTALLGGNAIPAGQYRAVRLILDGDSSNIRYKNGSLAQVHWGGSGHQAIHAFVEAAVDVGAQGTDIVIDFDVGRSFHYNDLGDGAFNFIPWIRAVNRAETGSIAGTVRGPSGAVNGATVSAWGGGPSNWYIYSTGVTDTGGHYRLAYLLPGTYIVGVDAPASSNFGSVLDSNVAVNKGFETTHNVTLSVFGGSLTILGASSMLQNRTNQLEAHIINAQHQWDTTAAVAWQNLDNAVLGLVPNGRFAAVTSKTVGTGRVVATSGSLLDTLVIHVAVDTSSGPSAPR
jgi:uncharacterized protein DUF4382/carboxypeptidase family protein